MKKIGVSLSGYFNTFIANRKWMSLPWWTRVMESSNVNIYEKFHSGRGLQTTRLQDKWMVRMNDEF